jgi:hypothetical protein
LKENCPSQIPLPQAMVSNSTTENANTQEESARIIKGFAEWKIFCMLLADPAFQGG